MGDSIYENTNKAENYASATGYFGEYREKYRACILSLHNNRYFKLNIGFSGVIDLRMSITL